MTSTVTTDLTTVADPSPLPAAGLVAGPLFIAVAMTQVALVPGFDLDRHPLSLLALGPWGLVQVANFVVTGALLVLAGTGLGRVMPPGPGSVWGPRLVAGFGCGMILAGVFVADPAEGFPAGTSAGPGDVSWHGAVHAAGFAVAMLSWTAACPVFARWFAARRDRLSSQLCAGAPVAVVLLAAAGPGSLGLRLVLVSAVQLAAVAAVCLRLGRRIP